MPSLYIDFEWSRDAKGYRLEHGRIVGNGGKRLAYRPLDEFPTLYNVFAKTPQTPKGVLDFVQKFGRLTGLDLMAMTFAKWFPTSTWCR